MPMCYALKIQRIPNHHKNSNNVVVQACKTRKVNKTHLNPDVKSQPCQFGLYWRKKKCPH